MPQDNIKINSLFKFRSLHLNFITGKAGGEYSNTKSVSKFSFSAIIFNRLSGPGLSLASGVKQACITFNNFWSTVLSLLIQLCSLASLSSTAAPVEQFPRLIIFLRTCPTLALGQNSCIPKICLAKIIPSAQMSA